MRPVDSAKQIMTRRRSPFTEVHWVPRSMEHPSCRSTVRQDYERSARSQFLPWAGHPMGAPVPPPSAAVTGPQ